MDNNIMRKIPKMDKILEWQSVAEASEGLPRAAVREAISKELDQLRKELLEAGEKAVIPPDEELANRMAKAVSSAGKFRLQNLVNATGIVLHTNFGRAPTGREIAEHVAKIAAGYSNLEYDLDKGCRGSRYDLIEETICEITGAEGALVVNNNAAAVFLMLNTLAKGKNVVISRGELVEIGGAFRIPDIMEESGAHLMEVGTTNKTHLSDYENAVLKRGGQALLKVHHSNFEQSGFTESVDITLLSDLAKTYDIPLLFDLGAAFMVRPEELNLHKGSYLQDVVKYADICCFSGDKLFGAGQAGIVVGKKPMIEAMKKNQLMRILRVDKMTFASLEAALKWYKDPAYAIEHIPALSMLSAKDEDLERRARELAERIGGEVIPCEDEPGGGSLPGVKLTGWAVQLKPGTLSVDALAERLRRNETPIIARIHNDALLLSVRTLMPGDEDVIAEAVKNAD